MTPETQALPPNFDLTQLGQLQNGQAVNEDHKGDEALLVRFYANPVDDRVHVEIRTPGDDRMIYDYYADQRYIDRFPQQWALYMGLAKDFEGQTRLELVNWIDAGNIAELKRHHIHTVEHLAGRTAYTRFT